MTPAAMGEAPRRADDQARTCCGQKYSFGRLAEDEKREEDDEGEEDEGEAGMGRHGQVVEAAPVHPRVGAGGGCIAP